jgi:phosphoglycerate kinase
VIRSITDVDVRGKKILTRVDFNVPQDDERRITDDTRISESLPTIESIVSRGGIPVLMSHLGRPNGKRNEKYSLNPVAERLADLTHKEVLFAPDCIGKEVEDLVRSAAPNQIILLENLRFHAGEEGNDSAFCKQLRMLGDVYCNDAFGTAHRAHSSTSGVAALFDTVCAGLLMLKELQYLGSALEKPQRPFISVLGGSKISGKIEVISSLLGKCDAILIGGGMMYTFLKAMGKEIGTSLVEEDRIDTAKTLLDSARALGVNLAVPADAVVADAFSNDAQTQIVDVDHIPQNWMGMDIGPSTVETYSSMIANAGTVVWNGPMGVFEMPNFSHGTRAIASAMAESTRKGAITIIGGGDSAAAISQFGLSTSVTHVSTGGGASLEYLEGKTLPGVAALNK